MNDRRPLIAIALILVISVAPMFWNRPAPLPVGADSSVVSKAGGPAPLAGAINAPATMQAAPTGDTIAPVVRAPGCTRPGYHAGVRGHRPRSRRR